MGVIVSAEGGRPASAARASAARDVDASGARYDARGVRAALERVRDPCALVRVGGELIAAPLSADGQMPADAPRGDLVAVLPALYPEWLGDRAFCAAHGARFPYVVGEMARGIATARMVVEGVRAGCMAFFGSAGLSLPEIEKGVRDIKTAVGDAKSWGANLIHSPQEEGMEIATVDLFHRLGVTCISASAFMRLQPAIVLFAAKGMRRRPDGGVERTGRILAKVSRREVARQFLEPPPEAMLRALVAAGKLASGEAELAATLPVAEDVTAEADSGGHTDNRPLGVLLPGLMRLRDEIVAARKYVVAPRVGAAGGLGDPLAVSAAFGMGAAYVVTGSVNQCAQESGLSRDARALLAQAQSTDVAMAPAADMFEMGVKVQVLKRGTLFAQRGQQLSDFYRRHDAFEDAAPETLAELESRVLGKSIAEIWAETEIHFRRADPAQIERARADPKHRMALVFRWYLFMGAQWAREGVEARRADYQIWCGPAMGGFNDWVRGSFLEPLDARTTRQIALNLLEGAAVATRASQLRAAGLPITSADASFRPRPFA